MKNVGVHNLSPGMVTTDLLMSGWLLSGCVVSSFAGWAAYKVGISAGADTPTAKFFINCMAEPAADVARSIVPRIRKVPQESKGLGGGLGKSTYIRYLTIPKAYSQILLRLLTGARKGRYLPED